MSAFDIVKTLPGETDFNLFLNLPQDLYDKESLRFRMGHDPSPTYLEGCYVLLRNRMPVARFSFYENPELRYLDQSTACIGSYECISDLVISNKLITYAKELASSKGYQWLIGPMEGSTWNSYRFSLDNKYPNFFLEPYHHSYYNDHFIKGGFEPIAQYFSKRDHKLEYDREKLESFEKHYKDKGAIFRNLNSNNLETELEKIAAFSIEAYSNNFLYTPITINDFAKKYLKIKQYLDPELVWIVEDGTGDIQALAFSLKDYYDAKGETLIIKSLARKKSSPYRGIGSVLVQKTIQTAIQSGYKNIIHAFMIKDNTSLQISKKHEAEPFVSYNLYGLKL